jgi:hypothetical protein
MPASSQPEIKSICINMGYAELAQAALVKAIDNVCKAAEAQDSVGPTGCVPTTLSRRRNDALRVRNDEVVGWLVAPKESATNSFDTTCMSCQLLWRERFEDHGILIIAIEAQTRMIYCPYDGCASNCL